MSEWKTNRRTQRKYISERDSEYMRRWRAKNRQKLRDEGNWNSKYSTDYFELITRGSACTCCGKTEDVEADHIIPQDRYILMSGSHSSSVGKRGTACARIIDLERGNLQPLCRSCDMSKGEGTHCKRHNKYLGVWNYLPKVEEMEE